jgi:hypothetical protein
MEDIAALEQRLFPPPKVERPPTSRTKPLIDLIVDCLPRDREFDVTMLYGWLREADPERKPSIDVVRTNVHRLLRQGVLKRTQRANGKLHALFAVASLEVNREPTVREWVERFIDQTRDPEELLVMMLDAGYQPNSDAKHALDAVMRAMRKA